MQNKLYAAAAIIAAALFSASCGRTLKDGDYTLTILSTNDVHGTWFDSTYVGGGIRKSIFAINHYVDSVRKAEGAGNVLLVDAGDCLQGDNAAYYYNYVDTASTHLFSRIMEYMRYDAVAVGNHDIETGHPVYDRVSVELKKGGADFLAGNAIRNDGRGTYFPLYKMVSKAGLRIAVLGYTNANIKAWLNESLWSGMHFESVAALIQKDVDMVRAKERPDVVVVTMHSACGQGDGTILESEALDCFNSVRGVDWLICGHDHIPYTEVRDSCALLNSGSHSRFLAHGKMHLSVKDGKIVSREFTTDLIPVKAECADTAMREAFRKDFLAVKQFTTREVGTLTKDVCTRDSYIGQSDYMNILHTLQMSADGVEVSIAAPLTFDGRVKAGKLIYHDLFTIYPFENQLYVVNMTGEEIRLLLEESYDRWIQSGSPQVLKIRNADNPRTGTRDWSFVRESFNFDSAAGINYQVYPLRPKGSRVVISSMADGAAFSGEKTYKVGMTSYRASGGGNLLAAAGIGPDQVDGRIVARLPELRNVLYDYLMKNGSLDPEAMAPALGKWSFEPAQVRERIKKDFDLVFANRALK